MTIRYLLDSDTCIYAMRGRAPRFQRHRPADCGVSAVVLGELMFGCLNSARPDYNRTVLDAFVQVLTIAPLDESVSTTYGEIRAALTNEGRVIGANDLWIAAHAKALGAILVTNNEREFRRVSGLRIANWTAS